jgi:hypothetical protein
MPPDPRAAAAAAARALLRTLADVPALPAVRVVEAGGRRACLVLVWDAAGRMPGVGAERRAADAGRRTGCRRDVVGVVRAAGRPLTRKQVVKALRAAGVGHGPGTVAKALADLTAAGELVNPRDKRGYRLGKLGRLKGGKARAAKLTPEQRAEIARKAAAARWK